MATTVKVGVPTDEDLDAGLWKFADADEALIERILEPLAGMVWAADAPIPTLADIGRVAVWVAKAREHLGWLTERVDAIEQAASVDLGAIVQDGGIADYPSLDRHGYPLTEGGRERWDETKSERVSR